MGTCSNCRREAYSLDTCFHCRERLSELLKRIAELSKPTTTPRANLERINLLVRDLV